MTRDSGTSPDPNSDLAVRVGDADDYRSAMNVLDGAMLDVDPERVRIGLGAADGDDAGEGGDGDDDAAVLVAEREGTTVGALVLDGERVTAVAVRRSRRDEGVGTALIEEAVARRGRVTASFDARVRPFYESLGFEIRPVDGEGSDRLEGRLEGG